MKLNVTLAKTSALSKIYAGNIKDFIHFFKNNQREFKGEKKTYNARKDTVDQPSLKGITVVVTTVDEKIKWFIEHQSEYIDLLFEQEATNAEGIVTADVIVDNVAIFTGLSSLELLRLKNILETQEFLTMNQIIPTRDNKEVWSPATDAEYADRNVWQNPIIERIERTTVKTPYILEDTNILNLKDQSSYKPVVQTRDVIMELGESTWQLFSGEWSHLQRAKVLERISKLKVAVIEALERANAVETVSSDVTAKKLFGYIYDLK